MSIKILATYKKRRQIPTQSSLYVFKIQYRNSKNFIYMDYHELTKKYPRQLLNYLEPNVMAKRSMDDKKGSKEVSKEEPSQISQNQQNQEIQKKEEKPEPVKSQNSFSLERAQNSYSLERSQTISKQDKSTKGRQQQILDCDVEVDDEQSLIYPAYFKFRNSKSQGTKDDEEPGRRITRNLEKKMKRMSKRQKKQKGQRIAEKKQIKKSLRRIRKCRK